MGESKKQSKQFIGTVVSDKMDKTVVVMVERLVLHPLYKKYVRRRKKFMAHDEDNACRIGDKVLIEETRPLSRHKRWRVREILERAKVLEREETSA
ncbi:MAG TPA: 30S ribosomal protein S17 [Thermodesulfatator atlanticus]|uniref:Small ribosomal subunit protein uS17 n=1 Tax=Thermodesulfatator atlanticus TaxID=501497 RepID=A0A7V5NYS0_9BACT|nr:30S ribosomal protein S17 [Thermodesulfatator atlanticus]